MPVCPLVSISAAGPSGHTDAVADPETVNRHDIDDDVAPSARTFAALAADIERTRPPAARSRQGVVEAGRLAELLEWVAATAAGWPPSQWRRPRLVTLGTTATAVRALADSLGVGTYALELPSGASAAFGAGVSVADTEVDSGTDLLILATGGWSAAAAAVVSLLADIEPVALLPRGAQAVDTAGWIARAVEIRDTRRRIRSLRRDVDELLRAAGDARLGAAAGLLVRATSRRTPLVLDGLGALAAALLCQAEHSRAGSWWQLADTSGDPAHRHAVASLGQHPVLDLGTRSGDGTAGLLAAAALRSVTVLASGPEDESR